MQADDVPAPISYQFGRAKVSAIIDVYDAGPEIEHTVPGATPDVIKSTPGMEPFSYPDGRLKARVQGFLIEIDGKKILVDTCVGDNKKRDSFPRWNNQQTNNYIKNLERAGVKPDEITHVFCTHFHQDHVGANTTFDPTQGKHGKWVPTFKNARYLFSKTEDKFWSGRVKAFKHRLAKLPDIGRTYNDSIAPIKRARLADFIKIKTGRTLIKGLDCLTLIATPGHTPDHASLQLDIDGLKLIFTGDAAHHPAQLAHTDLAVVGNTNSTRATQSRDELVALGIETPENAGKVIYFGPHFDAGTAVTLSPDPVRPGKAQVKAFTPFDMPAFLKGAKPS